MLFEGSSDIIAKHIATTLNNGEAAECLEFHNGKCLVLSQQALGMYKDMASVTDPLGNGRIDTVTLPADEQLSNDQPWVTETVAGFIGLTNGRALLITPNYVQMFPTKTDALHNRNEIVRLDLS